MAGSGAACMMTQEQVGATSEVLGGMVSMEQSCTSWSAEGILHCSGLEEEILDYDESGNSEEDEIVDDADTNLGNVHFAGSGSLSDGKRSIGVLQKEFPKTVQHDRKGGKEEKKYANVHIPRGEKKGTSIIHVLSVAADDSSGNISALGVSSLGDNREDVVCFIMKQIDAGLNTFTISGICFSSWEVALVSLCMSWLYHGAFRVSELLGSKGKHDLLRSVRAKDGGVKL
ncbi:hypothetical protein NDU88_005427 [Pleurodeles waltl]|uniref:Uncharacterized protein n=1 Tax=Pleurodeles waltl TaxID=8319 RepID=A0AAV7VL25_PLEWA|nr:hypothetical protein NDU88_005427 [Pleurodeles waltl]